MAIIKKFASYQNLTNFQVFEIDKNPTSDYFRITELEPTLTGGKNGFLIEGSEYLKETTEIKIEILDVEGNPIYYEPGDGIPEYYEGTSKLVSIHVYEDTPIGVGRITILGELKNYVSQDGSILPIPDEWKGIYNVKWETEFRVDKTLPNETRVRFYKRPLVNITELVKPVFSKSVVTKTDSGKVYGSALIPPVGTDLSTWRAGTSYEIVRKRVGSDTGSFDSDIDGTTITIYTSTGGDEILHTAKVIEVVNDTTLIVDKPYTDSNGIVQNFPIRNPILPSTNDYPFSASYDDIENETIGETSITGSFAKIDISQLKTFVGDVARVKIFRKSRNAVGDYQFVQEAKLESQELLRDVTTSGNTEILYGSFTKDILYDTGSNGAPKYWISSSEYHPVTVDSSKLNRAAKIDFDNSIVRRDHPQYEYGENYTTNYQKLYTSESISLVEGNEYTLSFKTLISSSVEGDLSSWFGIQYNEASESYSTTQSLESASLFSGSYGSGDPWPQMYRTSGSFTENSGSNGFVTPGYYKLTWSSGSESFGGVWNYGGDGTRSFLGRVNYSEGPILSQQHTPQFVPFRNTFLLTTVDINGTDHYNNLRRTAHQEWNESTSKYEYLSQPDEYDGPTSWSLHVEKGTYYSGSENNYLLTASLSSSDFIEDFLVLSGSVQLQTKQDITKNIIAKNTGDAKLRFDVRGADWYISNVSIRNAQETSFSPDEFTIIQDIPRKTAIETFDFKFEFYDINNNFIPVEVLASKEFDGGNDFPTSGKLLTFESDRNAFRFSSGSIANPPNQTLQFKSTRQNLTGSLTFVSQAFDVGGNLITSQSYHDSGALVYGSSWTGSYPGLLTSITPVGALITIANFSGSLDTPTIPSESIIRVGSIIYTASLENVQEFETVFRLEDGDNAPQLIVTSNANQFIYEPTTLSPKPSGQNITIRAQRKNLASLITPIEVNSGSNLPELTYVSTAGGIDTYTISATAFSQSFAANNFDEVTYSFTGSDVFGNNQSDEITISKVINYDAVSLVLSNEATSFQAKSTGEVIGGFNSSSGSVQMFIGNNQIPHDDYDSDSAREKNTFDIKTITESNVTASSTSPTNEFYSITGFDTNKDSGSLTLNIEYLAGDNVTSQSFQKVVSYTKSKKAVPNVLTKVSPSTQTINSSSAGFETPQTMEVIVQEGGDEYTYDAVLGSPNTFHINSLGYTAGSASFDDEIITLFTDSVGDGSGTFITSGIIGSASIDYKNSEGTEVYNKTVRFDLSVSKEGIDGDPAKAVKLKTDRFIIKYDDYGNVTGSNTIGLTGSAQGYGTPEFQFLQNDTEIQAFSTTNTIEIPTDGGSLPAVDGTAFFEVRAREQGESYTNVDDELEVYGVGKGRIYTVFFTNESHNFPADEFGNLKDGALESGSTEVRFYKNIDGILREFTYDQNSPYGNNTFRTGSSPSDFDGITVSGSTLPSGRLKYTPTAVTALQGGFEIGFIDNSDTSNTELDRQYTFSIGEDGIKFKDLEIDISDSGNFIKPETTSVWNPSYLEINAIKSQITGSVTWTFGKNLYDSPTGGSTTTTGDTVYARYTDFVSDFESGIKKFPITASLTNSEDSVVYTDSDSIKVLQDGGSAITVDVSNPFEDVIATNGGFVDDYTDTGTDIEVYQGADLLTFTTGTAGDGQYTISTSISPANSIQLGTISGNGTTTFTISDHDDMDQDEDKVTITYTASGKRFDGTSFSRTGQQKIVKVKDAKPPLSPTSLRVSDSLDSTPFDGSPGTTGTPTISNTHYGLWNTSATAITTNTSFVNIGYLGLGATLTSDNNFSTDMKVYCQRTLEIGDVIVLYQDADNYGNYTVAAKTNADGSGDTVLQLTFVSSAGTLTVQSLDYIGFGRELVGPGVVYRGEYDSGTTYYYSETRRDVVEYSGTYYLASNPSDSGTSNWGTPGSSTDWETFGAEFSSVATDILFAQDVYANRTINIGSDGVNPVIALNSDHANSNANPYISIGAASYEGAGIFLGYDSGTAKTSLVNSDGTRYLKWDGSSLEIKGSITVTGGDAATQTQAQGYANTAESNAINAAESYADNVGENALLTGSIDSFELSLTSNMEIDGRKLRKTANDNVWNGEVRSGVSFTDGAVVSFKVENTASGRRFMMGLNSDPTTDTNHTSIDYHWYINGTQAIERVGSGNASGAANVTITNGDYFTIVYDGTRILWYHNSTLTNSISTNAGQRFFLDSSFYDTTTLPICTWFTFGPDSPKNDSSKTDGEVGGWTITSTEIQGGTVSGGGNAAFTTSGMRLGSTGYISAPQFYIDASGNAKFKGSLEAASGTFSGALKVGSIETSASDVVDGASAGSTAAQPGDDISGFNNDSGYQDNDADKTGGSVGGWAITSLAIKGGSPTSGGDGVFTNTGIIFGIDGSNDAYISAKNFYIDTDGNAKFSGTVSGSSIQGGTMTIGDNFNVDNAGNMTAQDATISGSFSIDGGTLGSWIVESPSIGGRLRNEYDVSAPGTGSLVFEPSIPEIQGYKIDGNNVDKKISIHPENTWVSAAGGNQGSSIENNNGSSGGNWSLPSNRTSSGTTSTVQYNSTDQDLAGVIDGVGTATTFTIPQAGTFEVTGLANLSSLTMSTPSSITGNVTTGYPSYNGMTTYQLHVPLVVAKAHYFTIDLIFKNTSTNVETTVNVQTIVARGAKTQNGYQWNGSSWQSYTNTSSSSPASTSFASVSKTVSLSSGNYNAFYRIRNGAASGYVQQPSQSTGMYGSIPPVYSTTTNSVTSVGYNSLSFTVVIPSNLIEISSKGIQILNDTTNYIQILRTDTVTGTPEVISIKGGKIKMYHKDYSAGYGLTSMLDVDGQGAFRGLSVSRQYSGTNTNQLGFNSDIVPRYTNGLDIGNANFLWDDIYATSGTVNTSDRNEKENISGSILGLDFVNNLRPVKFNFISGSRTHYGLISQEVSESLASSSVHTDDFGGFIRTDLYNSGSEELVPEYIIKKNPDEFSSIDNWTYSGESKYALRYTEFIAPMIKAIQELSTKVNELEAQISGSI